MKKIKIAIIAPIFACLFLSYTPAWAGTDNGKGNDGQNNGRGNENNNGHQNDGSGASALPINNGILFLAAAGIAIGYTVIKRKKAALNAE